MSTRPTITPRMAQDAALALGPDLTDEACPYGLSNATPAELHNLVTLARIIEEANR